MNNDFTWEKIVDWVEGRLPEPESDAFAAGLANASDATQAEVAWLQAFAKLSASANVPLKHLSDATRQRLRAQFEQLNVPHRSPFQPLAALSRAFRVFAASLSSDSWTTPLVGVRYGDVPRDSRQLIYTSELADIALNIRPRNRDGVLDLRCQLFATHNALNLQSISAQLVQGALFLQTQVTDLGDFVFSQLQPGNYDLSLLNDDFEIAIPNLALSL